MIDRNLLGNFLLRRQLLAILIDKVVKQYLLKVVQVIILENG